MAVPYAIHRAFAYWQIRVAIRRLVHRNPRVRDSAATALRAAGAACWPQLRAAAFRSQSRLAVAAADLLDQMGDGQGLIALLSQFAASENWYEAEIRDALRRIGSERIAAVLDRSLERLEEPGLPRYNPALQVAANALYALAALHGSVSYDLWRRALMITQPHFEDLRTCRSLLPGSASYAEMADSEVVLLLSHTRRVSSNLVAVRLAAVEALLTIARADAFDLLAYALRHPDPRVQCTAIYGLRRLRDTRAMVLLQPIAADRRNPLARDARRAIEAFGTRQPDALTLVRAASSSSADERELLLPSHDAGRTAPETLLRAPAGITECELSPDSVSSNSAVECAVSQRDINHGSVSQSIVNQFNGSREPQGPETP